MKKVLSLVAVMGLLAFAGCGGGGDSTDVGGGGQTADLDTEQQAISDMLLQSTQGFGTLASMAVPGAKVGAAKRSQYIPAFEHAYFNEPIPGFSGGSATRNGNMHGGITITVPEGTGTASGIISGNGLTMVTFDHAVYNGCEFNGRMSEGLTLSGSVNVNAGGGTGDLTVVDDLNSQSDFTVNGHSHNYSLKTTIVVRINANGTTSATGTQIGIIDSTPVARSF